MTKVVPFSHTELWQGSPHPLGATWDGQGVNFALYSRHAEQVELCLFDESGRRELERIALRERTDFVWHGYLPQVRPAQLYGYRVHGPYQPDKGHRFNPHKLLLDPYARSIVGHIRWSDAHYGYTIGHKRDDLSFAILTFVAATGVALVSYIRARAEAASLSCKSGLLERPERTILLIIGLCFGLLKPAVILLAVLAHLTAVQRILIVRRAAKG